MRHLLLFICVIASAKIFSQTYQPTWQSLDQRPVPQWFKDSKFGIFIHWGVYAVPGWCTKGNYAEWYQYGLMNGDTARLKFHSTKFGDRSYYDLANDFKAELFNPHEWAKVFEQSGAKYIVLTSKHHDGYTLWPSKEANRTWGFPWNAADVGPKRDLIKDLFSAVRKTSVHAGMYYSLYEWFNPLWKNDPKKFAIEHTWPQMKDLITNYQPDVFWTDGDWDASEDVWKSKEFLTWLYNESPVRDKVVTYDRWGSGVRFKHGLVYTPEYQPDLDFEDHYWEESRGMGFSYGYNREEDAWDYNSTQSLVLQLIDKVSRGGNFLLDIGPDEHGKIPPIMQERLLQIGEWLKINGEAIYGTSRWKESGQWSNGRRGFTSKSGDMLLKITIDPDAGYAVKEIFYTYNETTNSLYAIFPVYPSNKKLILKNVSLPGGTKINFLSTRENASWKQDGPNVVVDLPEYNPNQIRSPYAFAVKIENYGKFTRKPSLKMEYAKAALKPTIFLNAVPGAKIYYTLDGSEPTPGSVLYQKPFSLDRTAIIKATTIKDGELQSGTVTSEAKVYRWVGASKVSNPKPGISYRYFEPMGKINLESVQSQPTKEGVTEVISLTNKQRKDKFAFVFEGFIKIEREGFYTFSTISDDGSKLFIDDAETVNNDGDHGSVEQTGKAALKIGYHRIKVVYFDSGGDSSLKVVMQEEGGTKQEVGGHLLFH